MKFKSAKGYIIGAIVGASLMFSFQSFAEDGLTQISAYLRSGLPFTLDGKKVVLDNPVITYNNSTYVKLRDITKLTGNGVNYNDATGTVELTSVSGVSVSVGGLGSSTSTSSLDSTLTPTPTPDPQQLIPATRDDAYFNSVTTNLTVSTSADDLIFYNASDISLDLTKHYFGQIKFRYKGMDQFLEYNNKSIPIKNGINYLYIDDSQSFVSKSVFMQLLSTEYLSRFQKYSVDFNSKTFNTIN